MYMCFVDNRICCSLNMAGLQMLLLVLTTVWRGHDALESNVWLNSQTDHFCQHLCRVDLSSCNILLNRKNSITICNKCRVKCLHECRKNIKYQTMNTNGVERENPSLYSRFNEIIWFFKQLKLRRFYEWCSDSRRLSRQRRECPGYSICEEHTCFWRGTCVIQGGCTKCNCNDSYTGEQCQQIKFTSAPFNSRKNYKDVPQSITTVNAENRKPSRNEQKKLSRALLDNWAKSATVARDVFHGVHKNTFNCFGHGECRLVKHENGVDVPSCFCDPSWTGRYCHLPCSKTCQNGGQCKFKTHTATCSCPHGYAGALCEQKLELNVTRAKETIFGMTAPYSMWNSSNVTNKYYIWNSTRSNLLDEINPFINVQTSNNKAVVIGASIGTSLVFVVISLLIAGIVLWKKRVLILMKLVYRFQSYEDDDNKEYDAFISYKSSTQDRSASREEQFVTKTLLPKLEQLGFKICVHFRDFIPGISISDNVLHAIENSRRTIMLVSVAYVADSVWCKFEFQQAQVAVLERKQRILPILFEDISKMEITDPTLSQILQQYTYLEMPSDITDAKAMEQFWLRLTLSMPKKRAPGPVTELGWQQSCDSAATEFTVVSQDGSSIDYDDPRKSVYMDSGIDSSDAMELHELTPIHSPTDKTFDYLYELKDPIVPNGTMKSYPNTNNTIIPWSINRDIIAYPFISTEYAKDRRISTNFETENSQRKMLNSYVYI